MICVGTDLDTSSKAIELAEKYEGVWASVGLHPNDNLEEEYEEINYERLASSSSSVVAIGEIGLDYYRTTQPKLRETQRTRFISQLSLAERMNLPVIIHCREAHEDMISILSGVKCGGVIHSFTGNREQADQYVRLGYSIGFNGIATFTTQYDEVIRSMPLAKIILETDSPYLTPEPNRGRRNKPGYVIGIAAHIANVRGENIDDFIKATKDNTLRQFNIRVNHN